MICKNDNEQYYIHTKDFHKTIVDHDPNNKLELFDRNEFLFSNEFQVFFNSAINMTSE